jgi:DNA-binding Lrp family transcriptional regulator
MTVRFRRHLADQAVTGRDAEIVAPLRGRARMPLGSLAVLLGLTLADTERRLRDLEARRIIRVDLEPR